MLKNCLKNFRSFQLWDAFIGSLSEPLTIQYESLNVDGFNIIHLGSKYGGWSFVNGRDLNGCTIVSAGLGEDASFDVEFASKYNVKVIIIDPTPRAISHFKKISEAIGNPSKQEYLQDRCHPIDVYNLSAVT